MALALSGSGAGDSREAGSHGASTGTGTCRGEQSPEEGLTTFPSWAVMVVKAILEREKLLVGALDNELPGSPVLHPTSLASSGQMLHPPQAPDEAR